MKSICRYLITGIFLLVLSFTIYFAQIMIFNKTEDTFFYLLQDIAFIPVQILIVTIIVNELMARSEKRSMLKKMNMVIGAFFSEVGTELLRHFVTYDMNCEEMKKELAIDSIWDENRFRNAVQYVKRHNYCLSCEGGALLELKAFLASKRTFMLSLLENQNLLEHTSFTDMLWAIFHLTEELDYRKNVECLSKTDCEHVIGDIKRAYGALVEEWLLYVFHLKTDYPFIYSLVTRVNPFCSDARAELRE